LKFGREIDLDELELFSDRTKEMDMEKLLLLERNKSEQAYQSLQKKNERVAEELIIATKEHTKHLQQLSKWMDMKRSIAIELNAQTQQTISPGMNNNLEDFREYEERKRISAYTKFQATELEALRTELNMLKRKEAPIFSYSTPPILPRSLSAGNNNNNSMADGSNNNNNIQFSKTNNLESDFKLPPIPNNKR
jgi:hypothetical protein